MPPYANYLLLKQQLIRRFVVLLVAAGFTVGVPALFPENRDRKPYYLSWTLAAAGFVLVLSAAEFLGKYGAWIFAFLIMLAMLWLDSLTRSVNSKQWLTPKRRKIVLGISMGLLSGREILVGTELFIKPLPDLSVSGDLVPAGIFLFCYVLLNLIVHSLS